MKLRIGVRIPVPEQSNMDLPEKAYALAEELRSMVKQHYNYILQYNDVGLIWLEEKIERLRHHVDPETNPMVERMGAFLGETFVAVYGGEWVIDDERWSVKIGEECSVYPMEKTYKQFVNGLSDGIYGFFTSVAITCNLGEKRRPE